MKAAVVDGDAKKLAELMRQNPGFKVNMDQNVPGGHTLLHYACLDDSRSAVIPILLSHPDIDVNMKEHYGWTPFFAACHNGITSCVREMLKDSRVKVNEPASSESSPLRWAVYKGHLDIIKWWIASGREMDLGEAGDAKTDIIGAAKKIEFGDNEDLKTRKTEVATLLERFKSDASQTKHAMRV